MAAGDPIDYTSYYADIATALGTIATNSTEIKNSLAIIATQTTTLAVHWEKSKGISKNCVNWVKVLVFIL